MAGARRFLGSRACCRRTEPPRARGEGGFALLEVVIAFSVLFLALTGIGVEMATQYSSVGSSRNEQAGQAVLARLLNEARALPFTVVAKGLSNSDTTATSTTTYMKKQGAGTAIWVLKGTTFGSGHGTGEVVNHYAPPSGLTPPPPFYQHKSCFTVSGASVTCTSSQSVFTALTFSSKYESKVVTSVTKTWLSHVIRVTVIVTWRAVSSGGNTGSPTKLVGQTLIYSKTVACTSLGLLTTPSPASCQPNFNASAIAGTGTIAIKPVTGVSTAIKGLSFTSFDLALPGSSSVQTLTQTSTVLGTAKASGATTSPTSALDQQSMVITKATNDLAAGTSDDQTLTLTQNAVPLTLTSSTSSYSITATPSPTDTGTSVSTTSATSTHACKKATGTVLTTALPCGYGLAAQGATATLAATLGPLGATTLASVAATPTHTNRVGTARYARAAATCPTTAKSGCINAAARGGLGTVKLAGLPAAVTSPAGWAGYLVQLSGFHAKATAWARSASTWLSGSATVAGTVSYYNGSGYSTLSVGSAAQSLPSNVVTVTSGTVTVEVTPHLVVGGATCTKTTTSSRLSQPHRYQCSVVPLAGTITYLVTQSDGTIADFTMTVGLATVSATASYQVAT